MSKLDFEGMSLQQLHGLVRDTSLSKRQLPEPNTASSFGPAPKLGECDRCGLPTGQLALARLTVQYNGFEFCCACCFEEWLDARQNETEKQ